MERTDNGRGTVRIKDLLERWGGRRETPVTAESYSIHLPVDAAARIHALADMYPGLGTEGILTDLISSALAELEATMPYVPGPKVISEDDHGDPVYEDAGPMPRFLELTRRYQDDLAGKTD